MYSTCTSGSGSGSGAHDCEKKRHRGEENQLRDEVKSREVRGSEET
jgi:hypothetical protein